MDARQALQVIQDYVDDAASFVETFEEEDLYGDDADRGRIPEDRRPIDPASPLPLDEALRTLAAAIGGGTDA